MCFILLFCGVGCISDDDNRISLAKLGLKEFNLCESEARLD